MAQAPSTETSAEKIDVRVVADAENGENVVDFKMKFGTTFGKMMAPWRQCNDFVLGFFLPASILKQHLIP